MAGIFLHNNLKSNLILNSFAIYNAYESPTGKKIKRVSIFFVQHVGYEVNTESLTHSYTFVRTTKIFTIF